MAAVLPAVAVAVVAAAIIGILITISIGSTTPDTVTASTAIVRSVTFIAKRTVDGDVAMSGRSSVSPSLPLPPDNSC